MTQHGFALCIEAKTAPTLPVGRDPEICDESPHDTVFRHRQTDVCPLQPHVGACQMLTAMALRTFYVAGEPRCRNCCAKDVRRTTSRCRYSPRGPPLAAR